MVQNTFSQEEDPIFFSEALSIHLPKYEEKAKQAYRFKNYERGRKLFDSLVKNGLNGSYMDNFTFYKLNSKPVSLYELKKPVYLITYATWCVSTKGEIPALNELAKKYSDRIDFVIIFWDSRKSTKNAAKEYHSSIKVLYVDELENKDAFVVKQLKHSLGLPTTFLLDGTKKILDIRRGVSHSYDKSMEESLDANYNSIYEGIANHLLQGREFNSKIEPVAVN